MSDFGPALDYVLNFEDPKREYKAVPDVGGSALAGINSRWFPKQFAEVAALSVDQRPAYVSQFYFNEFWSPMAIAKLNSQDIANRVLDMGVNAGMNAAVWLLQEALNFILAPDYLNEDGVLGRLTAFEANSADQARLLDLYREQRANYYRSKGDHELVPRGLA